MKRIAPLAAMVFVLETLTLALLGCSGDEPHASRASEDLSAALALDQKPLGAPAAAGAGGTMSPTSCLKALSQFPAAAPGCAKCLCGAATRCGAPCLDVLSCMLDHCAGSVLDDRKTRECLARDCETQISAAARANLPGWSLLNRCQSLCAGNSGEAAPNATPMSTPSEGEPSEPPEAGDGAEMP